MRLSRLIVCALTLAGFGCGGSNKSVKFQQQSFTFDGNDRKYAVYTPPSYDPKKQYPAILFLHGLFEGGNTGTGATKVGLGPAIANHPEWFNSVVVFAQTSGSWRDSKQLPLAIATLDDAQKRYGIDPNRVVVTGLSTGGAAVWMLGAKYPERFAGLMPLCAFSDDDEVKKLTHVPIWSFHNTLDPFVGVWNTNGMVKAINEAGGQAKETTYGAFGHDCWSATYGNEKAVQWMQSQSRAVSPKFITRQ